MQQSVAVLEILLHLTNVSSCLGQDASLGSLGQRHTPSGEEILELVNLSRNAYAALLFLCVARFSPNQRIDSILFDRSRLLHLLLSEPVAATSQSYIRTELVGSRTDPSRKRNRTGAVSSSNAGSFREQRVRVVPSWRQGHDWGLVYAVSIEACCILCEVVVVEGTVTS